MRLASTILMMTTLAMTCCWSPDVMAQAVDAASGKEINPSSSPAHESLTAVDRWIADGQFDKAAERLRFLDDQSVTIDLTHRLAQVARGLQKSGEQDAAIDFYLRAVASATSDHAGGMDNRSKTLIHLAAASALLQANKPAEAIDCVMPILSDRTDAAPEQHSIAVRLCLHVGSEALRQGKLTLAGRAYDIAVKHADDAQLEKARLGSAWTQATGGKNPEVAAEMLLKFVEDFPDNTDGHRALRLAATCFRQAGKTAESTKALHSLLDQWSESGSAEEIVRGHLSFPIKDIPGPVRRWVLGRGQQPQIQSTDATLCGLGIRVAAAEDDGTAMNAFATRLAAIDESGQITSDVLQQLVHANRMAEAEQIAAGLIAPLDPADVTTSVREAACRWAGRHQLWSMLSLASESSDPTTDPDSRTSTIERLFAEALMQTGRSAEAHPWWKQVVDARGADDFATLLRCAETATAHADPDEAAQRIAAANDAIDNDARRKSLVGMLSAELAIRRLDFDDARGTLEGIIRDPESVGQLRGRAQWLIGETHFLQEDYPAAIDAYRRVEGIDPDGPWIAASLVQAGKSFEQLGRTREASFCYSTLISRFADSPHAEAARTRIAALTPGNLAVTAPNQENIQAAETSVKLRR